MRNRQPVMSGGMMQRRGSCYRARGRRADAPALCLIALVVLTGSGVKQQLGGRQANHRLAVETRHGAQSDGWVSGIGGILGFADECSCADAGETAGSSGRADWLGRGGTSACRADGREGSSSTDTSSRGKPRAGRETSSSRTQTKGVEQREPKAHRGRARESARKRETGTSYDVRPNAQHLISSSVLRTTGTVRSANCPRRLPLFVGARGCCTCCHLTCGCCSDSRRRCLFTRARLSVRRLTRSLAPLRDVQSGFCSSRRPCAMPRSRTEKYGILHARHGVPP